MGLEPTTFCMAKGSVDPMGSDTTYGIRRYTTWLREDWPGRSAPSGGVGSPDLTWDLTWAHATAAKM
jgi:hypothetical protein